MIKDMDRSKLVGGSDIAAVMGLSRWKTPLALWAEKTGRIINDLSKFEAVEIGTELEEYVSRKFTRKSGVKLKVDNRTFTHTRYPYMVAHIDRWVVGEDALFEAKTCSAWKEKEWGGEDIPIEYVLQVNWYMGIVRKSKAYLAVLIGGQKFIWKEVKFDSELFEQQVAAAQVFMEQFVLTDVAPMAMAGDSDTLLGLFPVAKEAALSVEGSAAEQLNEWIEERSGCIEAIKHAEEECEALEAKIKQQLGENEVAETDKYKVTWKNGTRVTANIEALKADGLYEKYKKVSTFRALRTALRKS